MILDTTRLILNNISRKSDAKTWGGHDRKKTVGASAIGGCLRSIVFDKHNAPEDKDFVQDLGAAERGNMVEDWAVPSVQDSLKGSGVELIWATDEGQQTLVDIMTYQSATPDGLFISKDVFEVQQEDGSKKYTKCLYNELKSIDPRAFEHLREPKFQHRMQVQQGMDLVRRTTDYFPTHAVITYINASFVNQIKSWVIPFDEMVATGLRGRASSVYTKFDLENLPEPEGKIEGGKECVYCPYKLLCLDKEVSTIPNAEGSNFSAAITERLHEKVLARHKLNNEAKAKTREVKQLEQDIKEILKEADSKKISADWGSVSMYSQKAPMRYDTSKFKEAGLDHRDFQTQGDYSPRLSITYRT
jgi:hypothetical protein